MSLFWIVGFVASTIFMEHDICFAHWSLFQLFGRFEENIQESRVISAINSELTEQIAVSSAKFQGFLSC